MSRVGGEGARLLVSVTVLLVAGVSGAIELPGEAPPALQGISDCIRANAPGQTVRQVIELTTVDLLRAQHRYTIRSERKRSARGLSRLVLRATAPADVRGTAFLMIEQQGGPPDLFGYEPSEQTVRALEGAAAKKTLLVSDFSVEDVRRIQNPARAQGSRLLAETEVDGRVAWQIETRPAPEAGSAYTRIVSAVDKLRCVPLRMEFYIGDGEEPAKLLSVPSAHVAKHGDGWLPMLLTMRTLAANTRSEMVVTAVELDVAIPDRTFTKSALHVLLGPDQDEP